MNELVPALISSLTAEGPLVIAMAVAIYYLKSSDDRKAGANADLIALMNGERIQRIELLERHVDDCNRRHADAQRKYETLLLKVARMENPHPAA